MLIENLIRLGKPMIQGEMTPREVLLDICDVKDQKVKNFFQRIFVIEILRKEGEKVRIEVLPGQQWGEVGEGNDFRPDVQRAVGAPFVLPVGGNPLHPQGFYGIPVYPCWTKHLKSFQKDSKKIAAFLKGRIAKTQDIELDDAVISKIASKIYLLLSHLELEAKSLGLLILADLDEDNERYYLLKESLVTSDICEIGSSRVNPGKVIAANLDKILKGFWEAKVCEGAEKGERKGSCTICHQEADLVSAYSKSWPLMFPTWSCPLPVHFKDKQMVEHIALCSLCYKSLTYGAKLFMKLSVPLNYQVTREIFSPFDEGNIPKKRGNIPQLYGGGFALPILDEFLESGHERERFIEGMRTMINRKPRGGMDAHMREVIGFDWVLPEEINRDELRVNLLYYSGNINRGDIHIRAYIEDVIPSMLHKLKAISNSVVSYGNDLMKELRFSKESIEYRKNVLSLIPYLLTKAYGGSYLWDALQKVLHRETLSLNKHFANSARRIRSMVPQLPDTRWRIMDEVIFYLIYNQFLRLYCSEIKVERGDRLMTDWKEILKKVFEYPVKDLSFSSPSELGFSAGCLVASFGRQYYMATGGKQGGKDFLRHRVLVFGSSLTPNNIWKKALGQMLELEKKLDKIHLSSDFRQRVGVALAEYERLRSEIQSARDEFICSFWSGWALEGTRSKSKEDRDANIQK